MAGTGNPSQSRLQMTPPPRVLKQFARRLAAGRSSDFLLADLDEEFQQIYSTRGALPAFLFYLRQTIALLAVRWTARSGSGSAKKGNMFENFTNDVRFALRTYLKRPTFTVVAVLTIALGVGATTAVFSVVDNILIRPLTYTDPDELYQVWPGKTFSFEMIDELREEVESLEAVSSYTGWRLSLIGEGDPISINGAVVSANYFDVLGATAMLGRTFSSGDDRPGNSDVALLSYGLWQSKFGADSSVIGRRVRLGGAEHDMRTVVGVMPAEFRTRHRFVRAWVPATIDPASESYTNSWFNQAVVRANAGVAPELLEVQVQEFAQRARDRQPDRISEEQVALARAVSLHEAVTGDSRTTLLLLLGGISLVLLVACINVANLFLSLASSRQQELSLRRAVGASRGRIVSQLLSESLVLSVLGGVAGVGLAYATFSLVVGQIPVGLFPRLEEAVIDSRVLMFSLVLTLGTALVVGLSPAWQSLTSGDERTEELRGSARGASISRSTARLSSALVVGQVALALTLVFGSSVLLRSFNKINTASPGFDTDVLAMRLSLPPDRYEARDQRRAFYRDARREIDARPGVTSSGAIHLIPLESGNWGFPVFPDGVALEEGTPPPSANFRVITPGLLETLRYPLLEGRLPADSDVNGGEAIAVVNRRFARQFWPDESAVDRAVSIFSAGGQRFRIVGVVDDVHQFDVRIAPEPELYVPLEFFPLADTYMMIRADSDPMAIANSVKEALWSIDDEVAIDRVQLMSEVFGDSVASERVVATLVAAFALLALTLGGIGVYGVASNHVERRSREIGIRMALGAAPGRVAANTVGKSFQPVILGLLVGTAASLLSAPVLDSLVFNVSARDITSIAVGIAVLILAAGVAIVRPTLRASNVDPVAILAEE